ncbi:metal-dependent transcriptional regulator [Desulfococcus sp.]|uniref:metal-dependent transcriptional regulator n=1 Tax=Desulfococcus sp. TaxID=2025834 RepID=UPI0035932907
MEGLSENLENYLETILELQRGNTVARVKDIAEKIGVLSGTVTSALRTLSDKGLINYKPYSFITLTAEGEKIAVEILRRHHVIKDFLHSVLLLDEGRAEENACRMEHAMDKIAINRLVQFIEYVHKCPRAGDDWIANFKTFFSREKITGASCSECIEKSLENCGLKQTLPDDSGTPA